MGVTERVRQACRVFAVVWPSILLAGLVHIALSTKAGVEVVVLGGLVIVQVVWLALWFGTPIVARAVGRALGQRAD